MYLLCVLYYTTLHYTILYYTCVAYDDVYLESLVSPPHVRLAEEELAAQVGHLDAVHVRDDQLAPGACARTWPRSGQEVYRPDRDHQGTHCHIEDMTSHSYTCRIVLSIYMPRMYIFVSVDVMSHMYTSMSCELGHPSCLVST